MSGLVSALAVLSALHSAPADLRVENGRFLDAQNRVVTLRGMNVAGDAKLPPFMPINDARMLDPLPPLGINAIRLLFTWEAFEPREGEYSQAYLDYYTQAVRWAHERGIATVVDFHQDAMSRVMVGGCGEGFPEWTVPPYVVRYAPDNSARCGQWFAKMWFDNDLWRAWRGFYRNEYGIQDKYIAMARRVAQRLSQEPGVVGYNLLNEPAGDERRELGPFYEALGTAIRAEHPTAILFLEPHVRVDVGLTSQLEAPSYGNIAYAPHFYDPVPTLLGAYMGASFKRVFAALHAKADEMNAALFLGEFGTSPETRNAPAYMQTVYDRLDEEFLSGAQWSYSPNWDAVHKDGWNTEDLSIVDGSGNLRANYVARPYAQRIAGTPVRQQVRFNDDGMELELEWIADPEAGETEIFAPGAAKGIQFATQGDVRCAPLDEHHVGCHTVGEDMVGVRLKAPRN